MKKLIALSALVLACGPKPKPAEVPMLPGDGDTNVAKPSTPGGKASANDPWAGRTDLPVMDGAGAALGKVSVAGILAHGRQPA